MSVRGNFGLKLQNSPFNPNSHTAQLQLAKRLDFMHEKRLLQNAITFKIMKLITFEFCSDRPEQKVFHGAYYSEKQNKSLL